MGGHLRQTVGSQPTAAGGCLQRINDEERQKPVRCQPRTSDATTVVAIGCHWVGGGRSPSHTIDPATSSTKAPRAIQR